MSSTFCSEAAQVIAKHFTAHPFFKESKHIACYLAYGNEVNCEPIIHAIWQANKFCYLPIVAADKTLRFVPYQQDDELIANQFGILESVLKTTAFPPERLDVVLAPLIAFDKKGNRLGTGGGYYDRTFATLQAQSCLVGVAYAEQEVELLPSEPWDIKLRAIITQQGVKLF